jgi:hypothetical protein
MCKLIFEGIVNQNQEYFKLLAQNKYYLIPTVNVDGAALIEKTYKKDGIIIWKRTNMNINTPLNHTCTVDDAGVDLNRNYAYNWGTGDVDHIECKKIFEAFPGASAFSEPETRAMRDFILSKKKELKFVFNFHSYGKMVVMPINSESPSALREKHP